MEKKQEFKLPTAEEWVVMGAVFYLSTTSNVLTDVFIGRNPDGTWSLIKERGTEIYSEKNLCFLPVNKKNVEDNTFATKELAYECWYNNLKLD